MEDKINQITEQMNQVKAEMDERMDQVLNGYQNQIDDLRNQYDSRIEALEAEGLSSSDIYMDEQLVNLNNEITRLTNEADKVFEDLNKELNKKLEDLNKQLDFEEDKARRVGEKNKELDARMSELEKQGMSYGEMQLDPEVIRLQNEIEIITNELSEEEIAKREEARKQAEEKQKQEKEKNNAIKEYANLKEQKADLETKLKEAKKQIEEQNASLEKEKAGRLEAMKQLEERNNTNSPEYKEYVADIKRIEELLSENSKKSKIDEVTKNISDIETRMAELEGKFSKEVLEQVVPQQIEEPNFVQHGSSDEKTHTQIPSEDTKYIKYEKEPLLALDALQMAKAAYEMMTDEDKAYLEYAKNQFTDSKFLEFMKEQFPQLLQGNSEAEQSMICQALCNIHDNELRKETQPKAQEPESWDVNIQPDSVPTQKPQQPSSQSQSYQFTPAEPINIGPERTLDELMQQIKLNTMEIDLSTGHLLVEFNDNGNTIDWNSNINTEGEKVNLGETKAILKEMGIKLDKNMDPIMVSMICEAIDDKFIEYGISADKITPDVYEHYINQYKDSLNLDAKDEELAENMPLIAYIKTDKNFVMNDARGKGLDKIFRKYIRQAEYSPCVKIDESIDTRNWFEKLTDRVRRIFNPDPRIAENINEAMRDHQDDPQPVEAEVVTDDKETESKKSLGQQLHEKFVAFREEKASKVVKGELKNITPNEQGKSDLQKDDYDDMEP